MSNYAKFLPGTAFLSVLLSLCLVMPNTAAAQKTDKALFTDYAPWLCVGGTFVAMVGLSRDAPLIVVKIGTKGIEAPQRIPLTGNGVQGLQCSGSRIEVLAWKGGSDTPSILPFTVGYYEIYNEDRELLDWPNAQRARMPSAIKHRVDSMDWVGSRAGGWMRGDWYVLVPQVPDRPNNIYEVHFISTTEGNLAKLIVTLLEEVPGKKVVQSVPLVHIEAVDAND